MNETNTANDLWYYAQGETSLGPYTLAELQGRAQRAEINGETLVVQAGREDWMPFSSVINLVSMQPARQPSSSKTNPQTISSKTVKDGCVGLVLMALGLFALYATFCGKKENTDPVFGFDVKSLEKSLSEVIVKIDIQDSWRIKGWTYTRSGDDDMGVLSFHEKELTLAAVIDKQTGKVKSIGVFAPTYQATPIIDLIVLSMMVIQVASPPQFVGEDKKKAQEIITEASQKQGRAMAQAPSGLTMKAKVSPEKNEFMFYMEPIQ